MALITFEGGEGSGKSTQARTLYRGLRREGVPTIFIHEPDGTPLGKRVGYLLRWARNTHITPLSELFLFNACRAELVEHVIRPALKDGQTVICDRFADSTTAYQSYGRGLDLNLVKSINEIATGGLKPDLTFLCDIPAEMGLARQRGKKHDRFEREDLDFHQRVRQGYLQIATSDPKRWLIIDARQPKKDVAKIVWHAASRLLKAF